MLTAESAFNVPGDDIRAFRANTPPFEQSLFDVGRMANIAPIAFTEAMWGLAEH